MEKIKIYKDEYGVNFIKIRVNTNLNIPISGELDEISKHEALEELYGMESTDLFNILMENVEDFKVITVGDNIKHIEKPQISVEKQIFKVEKLLIPISDIILVIGIEVKKGNKFLHYDVSPYNCIDYDTLNKLKSFGIDHYIDGTTYVFTWTTFKK